MVARHSSVSRLQRCMLADCPIANIVSIPIEAKVHSVSLNNNLNSGYETFWFLRALTSIKFQETVFGADCRHRNNKVGLEESSVLFENHKLLSTLSLVRSYVCTPNIPFLRGEEKHEQHRRRKHKTGMGNRSIGLHRGK